MTTTNRSSRIKTIGATAAITVGLVAGGAGIAAAASSLAPHHEGHGAPDGPHGGPRGGAMGHGAGTVTASSATSLTVKAIDGTSTTYVLTTSTTFDKGRGAKATAADVTVGSHVFVEASRSNASEAATVHIVEPHLAGTVEKVWGSSFIIADEQGFWHTIDTSSSTSYAKAGSSTSSTASSSDVTVGTFVMATGTIADDHTTRDASSVSVGLPTPPAHPNGTAGAPDKDHDDD